MTREELVAFEADIAAEFNAGHIPFPVHLAGGNEEQLIDIFIRNIRPQDWIFCQWRSHYHCLLKGVPRSELKAAIMAGHSITLCFPEHRIFSSAIAGGHLPIALGVAWEIKREKRDERVFAFLGDMTAATGIANECFKYALLQRLPIVFVVENNGKSVMTDTASAWGGYAAFMPVGKQFYRYSYNLDWPHSGAGQRINFYWVTIPNCAAQCPFYRMLVRYFLVKLSPATVRQCARRSNIYRPSD